MVTPPFQRAVQTSQRASAEEERRKQLQLVANEIAPGSVVNDPDAFEDYLGETAVRVSQQTGEPPENVLKNLFDNTIGRAAGAAGRGALGAGRAIQGGAETATAPIAQQIGDISSGLGNAANPDNPNLNANQRATAEAIRQTVSAADQVSAASGGAVTESIVAPIAGQRGLGQAQRIDVNPRGIGTPGGGVRRINESRPNQFDDFRADVQARRQGQSIGQALTLAAERGAFREDENINPFIKAGIEAAADVTNFVPGAAVARGLRVGGRAADAAQGARTAGRLTDVAQTGARPIRNAREAGEALAQRSAQRQAANQRQVIPFGPNRTTEGVPGGVPTGAADDVPSQRLPVEPELPGSPRPIDAEFDRARAGRIAPPKPKPAPEPRLIGEVEPGGAVLTRGDNIFGLDVLAQDLGVTRDRTIINRVKSAIPAPVREAPGIRRVLNEGEDDVIDPIFKLRQQVKLNGRSRAVSVASELGPDYRRVFSVNKNGGIESLAGVDARVKGAPTIQDVAARLDTYGPQLTNEQRAYLGRVREKLNPYAKILKDTGDEFGTRPDIEPGGFYIPRGTAVDPDAPKLPRGASGGRGKPGFERSAQFTSQAEGIAAGREYPSFTESIQGLVDRSASRTADNFTANYLKTVRDINGEKFGLTAKELLMKKNPELAKRIQGLRNLRDRLSNLLGTRESKLQERLARFIDDPDEQDIDGVVRGLQKERVVNRGRLKGTSVEELKEARAEILRELRAIAPEYKQAMERITHTRDRSLIAGMEFPQLNGRYFPERMAARASDLAERESASLPESIRAVAAVQNVFKGAQATLDNSGVGIQALLVAYNDPRAFSKALRVNAKSFATPNAQGDFIREFNQKALRRGTFSMEELADNGLRILDAGEHEVVSTGLERVPVVGKPVRAANRAFAAMSNVARPEMVDDLVMEELVKGRTKADIIASGDLRRITDFANAATGIVDGNFDVANLITFSARFLTARIKTLARATRGMDIDAPLDVIPFAGRYTRKQGINPAARLEDKLARRAVLRMIGYGTMLTVAANAAQGHETDFRPFVGKRPNSNFMRVRAFNRDYSLFGPYDSVARLLASVGSGNFKFASRSLGSAPAIALGMDLFENKDYFGRPIIRPDASGPQATADVLSRFAESMIPFSADEAPENISMMAQAAGEGRFKDLGIGIITAITETAGIKSSPLSNAEMRELLEQPGLSPSTRRYLEDELKERKAGYKSGSFQRNPVYSLLGRQPGGTNESSPSSSPSRPTPQRTELVPLRRN